MIRFRHALLFFAALAVVGFAWAAFANLIQHRPGGETVFDNSGQPWPFFNQVAAINYDNGGQGVGYNVPVPSPGSCPDGSTYRPDPVNMKTSVAGAPAIPFQIGCNSGPNSFNYTINISQPGPYQITLQLADTSAGGAENIFLDGVQVATVPTPNTGSFDTFASSTSGPFSASLGIHKLTLAWGAGDSTFGGAGDILTWQGAQAPATAINSVAMSCGNSCSFVGGSAGTVGTAQAVMSTGSFAGTWSLRTSGTDNFSTTCKNYGSGFTIATQPDHTGVLSNGAIANGTYDGVCLVATQAGASGSPFAQAVTITGSGSGVPVPAIAQAAGFTTIARNWDFSLPLYANNANWLDTSGNSTDPTFDWHCNSVPGVATGLPCNVGQATDPSTGQTVMRMTYLQSYSSFGINNGYNIVAMSTHTKPGGAQTWVDFPNMYVEYINRLDTAYGAGSPNCGPDGGYFWSSRNDSAVEIDPGELHCESGGFGNSGLLNWATHNPFDLPWVSYSANNLPSGWSVTTYHKYGVLATGNGSDQIVCFFVDDILQACQSDIPNAQQVVNRWWQILQVGNNPGTSGFLTTDVNHYLQYIRIFSCANWALPASTSTVTPANMCNGTTLFTGSQNGQTLQYYH